MSGGHFEYQQYQIENIADDIERVINGREIDEWETESYIKDHWIDDDEAEFIRNHHRTVPASFYYNKKTVAEFRKAVRILKKAYVYAQRIDWLLSGDDGEESFHERLKEDLEELKRKKRK